MYYVLLSVICSVSVSVLIKYARQREVNTLQMFIWNYPCAIVLAYFTLSPQLSEFEENVLPFDILLPLSFLMFALFIVIVQSIQSSGVMKTEVAQRLSLLIPILAAYILFGEYINGGKLLGIVLGFLAIFLILYQKKTEATSSKNAVLFPVLVFFGMGIVDVLFKRLAQVDSFSYSTLLFVLFSLAFGFSLFFLLYLLIIKKQVFDKPALGWGLGMGVVNFGNILFYLRAHHNLPDNPSVVFTAMNIGVIIVGTIAGVYLFKEKLNKYNVYGVLLAILSVIVIVFV